MALDEVKLKSTILEGFGDDLVYAGIGFIATFITILASIIYWQRQNDHQGRIHSDSAENVQAVLAQRPTPSAPPRDPPRNPNMAPLTCPICLGEAEFAVETNCAHKFCSTCMLAYWRTGNWLGAIRCPVCRQTVTIMLKYFTSEERSSTSQTRLDIEREINQYNRRFSGQPLSVIEYLRDLPTILRHLVREFFSVGGLVWMFRMRIIVLFVIAFFYLISPLDLIPEAAFGLLGLLDDLFILLLLAIYCSIIYRRVVAAREQQAEQ